MNPPFKKEIENVEAQFRKGTLELSVLSVISTKREVYSSEIIKALSQSQILVVEGTIYPLLSRLKTMGLLQYKWRESKSGPPRKYYFLTDLGLKYLQELKQAWAKLVQSINSLIPQNE